MVQIMWLLSFEVIKMARNKLSFIVLGNNHADFTPYSVLIRLFEKLSKRKIPCAFKAEGPSDETLADATASTQRGIKQTQLVKQLCPEIQKLYSRDPNSTRMLLTKSAWKPTEAAVANKFMPLLPNEMQNPGTLRTVVLDVFRENAYLEELKLFQKLGQLQIHFTGIEADTKTYNQYMIASNGSEDAYYRNELMRIGHMVKNTMSDSLERFPEGGIVFIFTGGNHAHRLAANLFAHAKSEKPDLTNFGFHAFNLRSAFVKEWDEDNAAALDFTAPLDSPAIKEIYQLLPCPKIECKDVDNAFNFQELDMLVNELIQAFEVVKAPIPPIFSPLSPHDQLVIDIKGYLKQNPGAVSDTFMAHIETKRNYSLALRNACSWGNGALVKLIARHSDTLLIDFNQVSSNGSTPLAWFETSTASEVEKNEITALLKEKMKLKVSITAQPSA